MRAPGGSVKSLDALVKKAIELKEKGLSDKEAKSHAAAIFIAKGKGGDS